MPDDPENPDPEKDDPKSEPEDPDAGAKKALAAERKARRDAEQRAKDVEARLKELEDKDKSEVDKLREELAGVQKSLADVTSDRDKYQVALSKGLTAAHRTLPFGTLARVTDKRSGRSIVVRINDRGPFKRGRVIDLSSSAAKALGMNGLAQVVVTPVVRTAQQ